MTSSPPSEPKKVPLRIRLPFATEDEFVDRYGVHVGKGGVFIKGWVRDPHQLVAAAQLTVVGMDPQNLDETWLRFPRPDISPAQVTLQLSLEPLP